MRGNFNESFFNHCQHYLGSWTGENILRVDRFFRCQRTELDCVLNIRSDAHCISGLDLKRSMSYVVGVMIPLSIMAVAAAAIITAYADHCNRSIEQKSPLSHVEEIFTFGESQNLALESIMSDSGQDVHMELGEMKPQPQPQAQAQGKGNLYE